MRQGGAKTQEAAYIYDELIDKYGSSPSLLNGLAVARMHLQQWDEAEGTLKEAITKVCMTVLAFVRLLFVASLIMLCALRWAIILCSSCTQWCLPLSSRINTELDIRSAK